MSEKIIQLNEGIVMNKLKEMVRNSVDETLNETVGARIPAVAVPSSPNAKRTYESPSLPKAQAEHVEMHIHLKSASVDCLEWLKMPRIAPFLFAYSQSPTEP